MKVLKWLEDNCKDITIEKVQGEKPYKITFLEYVFSPVLASKEELMNVARSRGYTYGMEYKEIWVDIDKKEYFINYDGKVYVRID